MKIYLHASDNFFGSSRLAAGVLAFHVPPGRGPSSFI